MAQCAISKQTQVESKFYYCLSFVTIKMSYGEAEQAQHCTGCFYVTETAPRFYHMHFNISIISVLSAWAAAHPLIGAPWGHLE